MSISSAPEHLGDSARSAWDEIAAAEPVLFEGVERAALESYAVQLGRMRDAQRRIDAEGMVVPDEKGRPVAHPALAIERAAQTEVRKWIERYRRIPKRHR